MRPPRDDLWIFRAFMTVFGGALGLFVLSALVQGRSRVKIDRRPYTFTWGDGLEVHILGMAIGAALFLLAGRYPALLRRNVEATCASIGLSFQLLSWPTGRIKDVVGASIAGVLFATMAALFLQPSRRTDKRVWFWVGAIPLAALIWRGVPLLGRLLGF